MILNNVIEIMKSFDKEELRKFERFIRSDYFNTNESVMKLFKSIKKHYPEFTSSALEPQKLFKQIYGARRFDDKTFRYLITELMELAEKYLVISSYDTRPADEKKILVEELLEKRLFPQAVRHLKQLDKMIDESLFSIENIVYKKDTAILWNELVISMDRQESLSGKRIELTESLIFYFVIELANMFSIITAIKKIFNEELDDRIISVYIKNTDYKLILDELEKIEPSIEDPKKQMAVNALKAYLCYMITVLDIKDEEYFIKMKNIVKENADVFSRGELYNLMAMLNSCCNLKSESIDYYKYQREYFDIETFSLRRGLLTHTEGYYMQAGGFVNLFNIAITLNELKWAEEFLGKHIDKISPELRDDVYFYGMAQLFFEKGKYEKSLEMINKVRFSFMHFKQFVRALTLKIYYELNYFEEAFSLIDSYSHFIASNKKINPMAKNKNLNFLSLTKELLKLKSESGFKMKSVNIRERIESKTVILNKQWLLAKAKELDSQNAA